MTLSAGSILSAQEYVGFETMGQWNSPGPYFDQAYARNVDVDGDLACVAFGTGGIYLVDVSNLVELRQIGHCVPEGTAADVRLSGAYAYVAAGTGGLQIVDIHDPSTPVVVGSYKWGNYRWVYSVDVRGSLVVVGADDRVLLINVVHPSHPKVLSTFMTGARVRFDGDLVIVATAGVLEILDAVDPAHPVLLSSLNTKVSVNALAVSESRVYLADLMGGFEVIDVSDPTKPASVARVDTEGYSSAIAVADQRVYLKQGDGNLLVYEPRDATTYTLVGACFSEHNGGIEVRGSYVYTPAFSTLTILHTTLAPSGILEHPRDAGIRAGETATFHGSAVSVSPLSFRWQKDGAGLHDAGPVSGAMTPQLTISNVVAADAGTYRLVVSNEFGLLISSNAQLKVDTGSASLAEALDNEALPFFPGESNSWQLQRLVTHDGQDAAESPTIANGVAPMGARLESRVTGPGRLTFWWRIAATNDAPSVDFAIYFRSAMEQITATEEDFKAPASPWRQEQVSVPEGARDVSWTFTTWGGDTTPGTATAYLDEVVFMPDLKITVEPSDVQVGFGGIGRLTVATEGAEPKTFQWFYGESGETTMPIIGASNRDLCLPNLQASLRAWVRVQSGSAVANSRSASIKVIPRLEYAQISGDTLMVTARGCPGSKWQMEVSSDLRTWQPVTAVNPVDFQSPSIPVTLSLQESGHAFYRLTAVSP